MLLHVPLIRDCEFLTCVCLCLCPEQKHHTPKPVLQSFGLVAGTADDATSAFAHPLGPHFNAAVVQQAFVQLFTAALGDCTAFLRDDDNDNPSGCARARGPTFDSDAFVASRCRDVKVCSGAGEARVKHALVYWLTRLWGCR